jgi:hypothetical protein
MFARYQEEGLDFREEDLGQGLAHRSSSGLSRRLSTSLLLNYSPLDFMEALSEGDAFPGDTLPPTGPDSAFAVSALRPASG